MWNCYELPLTVARSVETEFHCFLTDGISRVSFRSGSANSQSSELLRLFDICPTFATFGWAVFGNKFKGVVDPKKHLTAEALENLEKITTTPGLRWQFGFSEVKQPLQFTIAENLTALKLATHLQFLSLFA